MGAESASSSSVMVPKPSISIVAACLPLANSPVGVEAAEAPEAAEVVAGFVSPPHAERPRTATPRVAETNVRRLTWALPRDRELARLV